MFTTVVCPFLCVVALETPVHVLVLVQHESPGGNQSSAQSRQISILRSQATLQKAIANIPVGQTITFAEKKDPAEWLSRSLETRFIKEDDRSGVLRIGLCGLPQNELPIIVNAVAEAFKRDVIGRQRIEHENLEKGLREQVEKLRKDSERYGEEYRNCRDNPEKKAVLLSQVNEAREQMTVFENWLSRVERNVAKGLPRAEVIQPAKP